MTTKKHATRRPFTSQELATVLAALRYWQNDVLNQEGARRGDAHFEEVNPLTASEVDDLCENLNFGDIAPLHVTIKPAEG